MLTSLVESAAPSPTAGRRSCMETLKLHVRPVLARLLPPPMASAARIPLAPRWSIFLPSAIDTLPLYGQVKNWALNGANDCEEEGVPNGAPRCVLLVGFIWRGQRAGDVLVAFQDNAVAAVHRDALAQRLDAHQQRGPYAADERVHLRRGYDPRIRLRVGRYAAVVVAPPDVVLADGHEHHLRLVFRDALEEHTCLPFKVISLKLF